MSIKRPGRRTGEFRHVSPSPSKIPYGGFSPVQLQTGYQPWRPSPVSRSAVSVRHASAPNPHWLISHHSPSASSPVVLADKISGSVARTPPVQRPLARQRVVLSHRVIAYYGRIRASPGFRRLICFHTADPSPSVFSGVALRGSPIYSACLSLRAVFHTPLDRKGAFDRFFPSRIGLRQFCNGSASKLSTQSDTTWWLHEAAKFTSCYGPADLLALHRSGLLLSSFRSLCRHRKRRVQLRGHTVNSRG